MIPTPALPASISSRAIIVVGDATSHGGTVLSGAALSTIDGRAMARLGDIVRCPLHGENAIVEGSSTYTLGGVPVALHGHRTACGSVLIGSCASTVSE